VYRPEALFGHALADVPVDLRDSAVFDDFVTAEPQNGSCSTTASCRRG
jgi:hypothetical protein